MTSVRVPRPRASTSIASVRTCAIRNSDLFIRSVLEHPPRPFNRSRPIVLEENYSRRLLVVLATKRYARTAGRTGGDGEMSCLALRSRVTSPWDCTSDGGGQSIFRFPGSNRYTDSWLTGFTGFSGNVFAYKYLPQDIYK